MKKISLMHIADMHLGTRISRFNSEINSLRMHEIQNTAMTVLKNANKYDIVLLPGDVFDLPDTPEYIADMFLDVVSSSPSTQFFYSCGNHDPYVSPIVDYCVRNCPVNLHIFGYEEVECVTLDSLSARVYGISFRQNHTPETLVGINDICDDSYINIMCVHGVIGKTEDEPYNPIFLSDIQKYGFDYLALGHIHTFSGVCRAGSLKYAYSGNLEPRGFDECGDKGYICGELGKDYDDLNFVCASRRKYIEKDIDISSFGSYSALIEAVGDHTDDRDDIYHFKLYGINNISTPLNIELIINNIDVFAAKISDFSKRDFEIEDFSEELTLKGACARETLRLCSGADGADAQMYRKACVALFDMLDGRGDSDDY